MKIALQGSKSFEDYNIFIRAMGVMLSSMSQEDTKIYLYSAGPARINSMVSEFSNLSERGLKARGYKIKFFKVAPTWITENIKEFDHFVYLSTPNDSKSTLVKQAELNELDVQIFRY